MVENKKRKGRPTPNDAVIGRNIKATRLVIGMSQKNLAALSGVTFQQIQKYENGKNRVSASMLLTISKALKVNLTTFYQGLIEDDNPKVNVCDLNAETLKLIRILNDIDDKKIVKSIITILS